MRSMLFRATVLASCPLLAFGQPASGFDVAVVKINPISRGMDRTVVPGSLIMTDVSLGYCLRWAYNIRDYQIIGPEWLRFDVRYDIAAKSGSAAPEDQLRLMQRQLLADRFKLVLHREKRDLPVYALTVAKGGIRMHRSAAEGEEKINSAGPYAYAAEHVSIARLLLFLAPSRRIPSGC